MQPQEEREKRRPAPLTLGGDDAPEDFTSPSNLMLTNLAKCGQNVPFSPALTWLAPGGQFFFSPTAVNSAGSSGSEGFWVGVNEGGEEHQHLKQMKNERQQHLSGGPMSLFHLQQGNRGMEASWTDRSPHVINQDQELDLIKEIIPSPSFVRNSHAKVNSSWDAETESPGVITDGRMRQGHRVQHVDKKQRIESANQTSPIGNMYRSDGFNQLSGYAGILSPLNYMPPRQFFPQQHHPAMQAFYHNPIEHHSEPPIRKLRNDGKVKDCGIKWTPGQDEQLKAAVQKYKESNWKSIAKMVEGRNHVQCLQRWKKVLQPGLIKGMWSPEEDELLLQLMKEHNGDKCWTKISETIPGRTAKQCRERFYLNLDPSINRAPWTQYEDDLLIALHNQLGNKWASIKRSLPGRTENGVKSRFKSLQRAIRKQHSVKK